MRLKTVPAVIAILAFFSSASAFTSQDLRYGDPMFATSARMMGMGGAGVAAAWGPSAAAENPALLAMAKEGWRVEFTPAVVNSDEARAFPIHDSFDAIIAYNTYAKNTTLYDRYMGGVAAKMNWGLRPSFGLFYSTRYDMNYDYYLERRDPDSQSVPRDQVIARKTIGVDGAVESLSGALAGRLGDAASFGVSIDYLRCNVDGIERLRYAIEDSTSMNYTSTVELDALSGYGFTLGAFFSITPRIAVGMRYVSEAKLEGDWNVGFESGESVSDSSSSVSLTYPDRVSIGIVYRPRAELRTTLAAQADYTNWSGFEDSLVQEPGTSDTWTFRFGVEHIFYNKVAARFGYVYDEDYMDDDIVSSSFTFGVGYPVVGFDVDFGGMVRTRDYRKGQDKITESILAGLLTVGYSF